VLAQRMRTTLQPDADGRPRLVCPTSGEERMDESVLYDLSLSKAATLSWSPLEVSMPSYSTFKRAPTGNLGSAP
jgi:hypothetical protein